MLKKCFNIFFILQCFFALNAFAQEAAVTDTATKEKEKEALLKGDVFYFYDKSYQVGVPSLGFIDTVGYHIQRYDLSQQDNKIRAERGNIGLADQCLEFELDDNVGFNYGIDLFETYRFKFDNTPFYQTVNPYTDLYYAFGFAGKANVFSVLHSQNVVRGLNLGIEYRNISSTGIYQNQSAKQHTLRLFGNYISKNQQYRVLGGYYYNKIMTQENGGIVSDTFVTSNNSNYLNRNVIPVNLTSAENKWRENSFYLKQAYHFVGGKADTSLLPFSLGYISLSTDVNRYSRLYIDNSLKDGFYDDFYLDTLRTFDSVFIFSIKNKFFWSFGDLEDFSQQRLVKLAIGFTQEYVAVNYDSIHQKEDNYITPFARLQLSWKNKIILDGEYNAVVGGDNDKDYMLKGTVKYNFHPNENQDGIVAFFTISEKQPDWFMQYEYANNYMWDNVFNKQTNKKIGIKIDFKGIELSGSITNFDQYVCLKKNGVEQSNEQFSLLQGVFAKDFKLGRFHIDNRIVYQQLSDEQYLHLPTLLLKQSYYVDFMVVKKALLRLGVDVTYNTKYYADGYNPALGSYYWQEETKTGNYVYLDPFITFNIKRANLFLKYSHANFFIAPYDFFMTPHYPINDGSLCLGVRWKFYD